jgi:hypothetical protein
MIHSTARARLTAGMLSLPLVLASGAAATARSPMASRWRIFAFVARWSTPGSGWTAPSRSSSQRWPPRSVSVARVLADPGSTSRPRGALSLTGVSRVLAPSPLPVRRIGRRCPSWDHGCRRSDGPHVEDPVRIDPTAFPVAPLPGRE